MRKYREPAHGCANEICKCVYAIGFFEKRYAIIKEENYAKQHYQEIRKTPTLYKNQR